jgi:hypothetical protein
MAEKVEIDIPGIGLIEAKNAATEATLLEILDVLKSTQKDNNKNAKDKGKGGAGSGGAGKADAGNMAAFNKEQQGATKSFSVLGAAARGVGMAFTGVGKAAGIAVGGFNRMAGGAAMAAGATVTFGQKALAAGESMTDLIERMANVGDSTTAAANALRVIPGVGGILGNVLGAVAGQIEKSVASYQTAASVGATFNGSVQDMSRAASGAGMTLDQFANLIKNNAENLIYLGGTTESGAKAFAGLAKELQGSGAGAELQRLGFTTEQINSGMARYIGILGKTGALSGMTTSQIAAASGSYLKELDGLAKITGQTREEKQKEQDALMKDAQVRAAMAGMDAESQKQMMNYITSFPKEQQAAIKDMIATGNVTSEEAIKLQSMLPGVAEQTMQFGRTMQAGGKINAEQMNSARNNAIREAKDSVMRNKARGMYDKEAGEAYVGAANLASMEIDGLSKAMGEQSKATDKANLAENLTKAKQRLAEFSNSFQMALANSGMLDTLMNVFQTLGNFVLSVIVPVFKVFAEALNTVIPMVTAFLIPAFKMLGEFVNNTIMPAFQVLGAWVKDGLMPIFTSLWGTVSTVVTSLTSLVGGVMGTVSVVEDIFEPALYAISDFIEDHLTAALTTLAIVAIPAVIAKMATMAMSMLGTIANFIALNMPMIGFTIAVGAMIFLFKKFGVDLGVVTDALKWAGSWISTLFLKLQYGIYYLLNKIPGMRGDFDSDLKSISEKMTDNEKDRAKLEEDMAKRRQDNLKKEEDKENSRANRDEKRAERRDKREKDAIKNKENAELGAIDKKEEREKAAAAEAKGVTVDKSDPIQMLKTFAAQQKSAFTQEAKALDDKDKARSDLALASQEYAKAVEQNGKATTDLERKAAEERMKAAEERLGKANKANESADEVVKAAAERMKAAKEGKDPGAVASGKPKEEKTETAKAPEASGKPAGSSGPQEGVKTDAAMAKYLQTIALIESGGDKNAKAGTSSASGMFQFTEGTWKQMTKEMGKDYSKEDRFDPKKAAEVAEYFSKKQKSQIEKSTGREAGMTDMYMAHFLGAGGASKFLKAKDKDPTQSAAALDPAAAKANKNIYYNKEGKERSVQEVYDLMDKKVKAQSERVEKGKVNADVAAIGGGSYKPGTKVDAVAEGKPKPQDTKTETKPEDAAKARADAAANDPRRTDKPVAQAETKKEEKPVAQAQGEVKKEEASVGTLQGLMRDGIIPTTMAFQDLVSKGIKPFQGMLNGVQTKTPLKEEAKPAQIKPEDSLKPGEELVKATAEAQAKIAQSAQESNKTRGMYDKDAATAYVGASDQAKAVQASMTEGAKFMFSGFDTFATDLSSGMTKTFSFVGTDLSSTFSDKLRGTMDDGLGLFTTDLADNFSAFESLDLPSMVSGLDDYTKQIFAASDEIAKGEAAIAQQEAAIAEASAHLSDPSVDNKDEIAAAVSAMKENIQLQQATIGFNKDVIDKNIMARAETPLTELVAQANKDAQEKIRLAEEAAEKEKQSQAATMLAGNSQEGALSGSSDLNTALAELIAISKRTADLNEKQLSVQSTLSGDLFA